MILIFMLTSGGLGSIKTFPLFIQWVSWISPQRYACQGFFLRLIGQIPNDAPEYLRDSAISTLGYDEFGEWRCIGALIGIFLFFSVGGWVALELRSRK